MRTAMTISLPEALAKDIRREAKAGNFASASEYLRHILREYRRLSLASELKSQKREFEKGKGVVLKSLKDLR